MRLDAALPATIDNMSSSSTYGTPLLTHYYYDALGNLARVELPNGLSQNYTYDTLNRLDLETILNGTTLVKSFDYELRADGNKLSETDTDADSTVTKIAWTYDALDRLASETYDVGNDGVNGTDDFGTTYTLDLVGNRLGQATDKPGTNNDDTITSLFNANDQLTSSTSSLNGSTTYLYDDNGSTTSKTTGGRKDNGPGFGKDNGPGFVN